MGSLVTVIGVRLTNDKQHAYLQISVLPITKIGTVKAILIKALPRARAYLSHRTNRHRVPALHLEISEDALKDRLVERKLKETGIS
ncbi:MAG: hypothetical protein NTV81_02885 [Candidatus Komeilibacteria bacterium]|nr:hypothetical protein [Candidatus Komeilibacteria bacterium]